VRLIILLFPIEADAGLAADLRNRHGLLPIEMRRLKQIEDENAKLKRIVADLSLDKKMLQDASIKGRA